MLGAWLVLPVVNGGSGDGVNPYVGILVMFAVGAAVGLANGLLVVLLQLDAFIVTLAMLILLRGITVGLSSGQTLYDLPGPMVYIGTASGSFRSRSGWPPCCMRSSASARASTASAAPSTRSAQREAGARRASGSTGC